MIPLKVAIMGCGGMSGHHAWRYSQMPEVQIVALCDVSAPIVEAYIEKHLPEYKSEPAIYTDYDRLLREQKPEAVTIVTPHTLHFEHGLKAIQAGCHVLMEKPMVTNSAQAHALKKAVDESGQILTIGYNSPSSPAMQWLREAIREQRFGPLETVTGWQSQNWASGTRGSWRQNLELSGGGQMYDSGAHMFNALVWSVESSVESVFAFVDNLDTPVDINGTVNVRFQNGVLATMTISGNCDAGGNAMTYTFPRARVEVDGWNGNWLRLYKGWGEAEKVELPDNAQNSTENFVGAVLGRNEAATSPLNGVIQSELMDAIYESARTGQSARPLAR